MLFGLFCCFFISTSLMVMILHGLHLGACIQYANQSKKPLTQKNHTRIIQLLAQTTQIPYIGHYFNEQYILQLSKVAQWQTLINFIQNRNYSPKFSTLYHVGLSYYYLQQYHKCKQFIYKAKEYAEKTSQIRLLNSILKQLIAHKILTNQQLRDYMENNEISEVYDHIQEEKVSEL